MKIVVPNKRSGLCQRLGSNLLWGVFLCVLGSAQVGALELDGEWQQGGLLIGRVSPGEQIEVSGRKVRIGPDGVFVIGLDRDAASELKVDVVKPSGERQSHTFSVKPREYAIQRINGVQQKHVSPPQEVLDRIAKETQQVRQARERDDPRTDFLATYIWPLAGPITGVYGSQRIYNGVPKQPHYGVDIAGPVGAKVVAPAPGVISFVHDDMYFSGGTMIIDHGHGLSSTFIHLSKILVEEGQVVRQGEAVAEVGATGRATGPHLDWRMNWFDQRIDPQLLVLDQPMK